MIVILERRKTLLQKSMYILFLSIYTDNLYLIFLSYLIGSISPSIIIGKFFYSKDIRDHGSGNAGTTNSFRIFGKKVGIIVLKCLYYHKYI